MGWVTNETHFDWVTCLDNKSWGNYFWGTHSEAIAHGIDLHRQDFYLAVQGDPRIPLMSGFELIDLLLKGCKDVDALDGLKEWLIVAKGDGDKESDLTNSLRGMTRNWMIDNGCLEACFTPQNVEYIETPNRSGSAPSAR